MNIVESPPDGSAGLNMFESRAGLRRLGLRERTFRNRDSPCWPPSVSAALGSGGEIPLVSNGEESADSIAVTDEDKRWRGRKGRLGTTKCCQRAIEGVKALYERHMNRVREGRMRSLQCEG